MTIKSIENPIAYEKVPMSIKVDPEQIDEVKLRAIHTGESVNDLLNRYISLGLSNDKILHEI